MCKGPHLRNSLSLVVPSMDLFQQSTACMYMLMKNQKQFPLQLRKDLGTVQIWVSYSNFDVFGPYIT